MGVIERVSRAIAMGDTPFDSASVGREAARLLQVESPWRESGVEEVLGHVLGLGPIQHLLDDPEITDIMVNGHEEVWVDRGNGLARVAVRFGSPDEVVTVIERAISPLGLRIDRLKPMVEARLPDGSRLHAVLPPAAVPSPLIAIRRFTQRVESLEQLVSLRAATEEQVRRLAEAVRSRDTIIVSGGTGSGKTTLLNLLGGLIPDGERVVTIEDAAELDLPGHVVRLEARPANAEGVGAITIRELLRSALRLRPDRIVVGEVRGDEALDLVGALNTGHRGSMATVHANSPVEALWRLETLALSAAPATEAVVRRQLLSAVDLVVQMDRAGSRAITHIAGREELTGVWS